MSCTSRDSVGGVTGKASGVLSLAGSAAAAAADAIDEPSPLPPPHTISSLLMQFHGVYDEAATMHSVEFGEVRARVLSP